MELRQEQYQDTMGVRSSLEGRSPINVNANFVACGARTGMNALVYSATEEGYPKLAELKVCVRDIRLF